MYRYVFKRVKETFEFGVNARKSYAYQQANSIKNQNQNERYQKQQQQQQVVSLQEINFLTPIDYHHKRYEDFKRKYNCKHPFSCDPFLQAITWSTALVAGFYASQLLCLYRRNRLDPKNSLYTRYLDHKHRFLQKKLSYCHYVKQKQQQRHAQHQRNFVTQSKQLCPLQKLLARKKTTQSTKSLSSKQEDKKIIEEDSVFGLRHEFATFGLFEQRFEKFYENFDNSSTYKRVYFNIDNLSNESTETVVNFEEDSKKITRNSDKSETKTQNADDFEIDAIMTNLTHIVGEMEFQLGVDSVLHGHYDEAVEHFRMAAGSNHASSLFNLGLLYEQGLGVKKDNVIAYELYKSAGELGHDKALYNQGIFHAKGLGGVKKSFRIAKRFFEKSAALGNLDAIEALSTLLPDYKKFLLHDPVDFIVADDVSKISLTFEKPQYGSNICSVAIT